MQEPLLSIKNLQLNFIAEENIFTAVKNISIEINKGELVAIVGESGSGKSVTALSVMKLLPEPPAQYTSGEILFKSKDGKLIDLLKCSKEDLHRIRGNEIGMIFQEPMTSLNPVHTCGDQVMENILLHQKISSKAAKEKTIELFRQVQLPEPEKIFSRYPHQISGGQKQRVMIAMAMSCKPSLLICDEPTTALDVTVQKTILDLIKNLQVQNNMGVIFITHDLGVVSEIADRIVVMYKGEIVEQGPAKEIYNNPQHPYTKALLACRPSLHPKGERLPVVIDFMETEASNKRTAVTQSELKKIQKPLIEKPILEVKNLKVYFPVKHNLFGKPIAFTKAVDGVSFYINEGETLGLVGESGCGKSTLGRAILHLIKPTSGEVSFKGINLSANDMDWKSLRKEMQIIFQDPYSSLNPRITIGEATAEPLLVHHLGENKKQRKEMVIDLLEKVGLSATHYNRYPHEFSGGQRQRIVIARALALRPSFVVCDESVSALDVSVQAQVLNLLNDLKKEFGFTALFISHDLSVIRYISDRVMVMNKGEIVETGTPDKIYQNPSSAYTKKLIESIPGRINV